MASQQTTDGLVLAPIRGVRYTDAYDLATVVSPPYDVIGEDELRRLLAAEPHNVVRLILPRGGFGDPSDRYRRAARMLHTWLADGVLTTDPEPTLYVYEKRRAGTDGDGGPVVEQRGLIGDVGLTPPSEGIVLPHEDVFPGPVADRFELMAATRANLEPIFLLYEGGGAASRLVDEVADTRMPLCTATIGAGSATATQHRLWAVTDPAEQATIDADLRARRALIADGHHRYATYLKLRDHYRAEGYGAGPWDFGLAMLVDSTSYPPRMGPIHRVLGDLEPGAAARAAAVYFRVRECHGGLEPALERLDRAAKHDVAFLVAGGGRVWLVSDPDHALLSAAMPAGRSALWNRLVTSVLHELIIPTLWHVREDDRTVRIVHHDAHAAVRQADACGGTAVLLPALRIPDVLAIAANGERVPRKSTSFSPKPPTGLVLRTFDTQPGESPGGAGDR